MRKCICLIVCVWVYLCLGISLLFAQPAEAMRVEIVFGPRVGVTYIAVNPEEFNKSLQETYPDESRSYFPMMTQFGVNLEQRIRLGDTDSHFAFQEVLVIGGIDQNIFLPSLSVLIGFRSRVGLEFGLGPNVTLVRSEEGLVPNLSVIYAAGWTFNFRDVFVPVNIAVVPTPTDGHPRVSFMTGFNFNL